MCLNKVLLLLLDQCVGRFAEELSAFLNKKSERFFGLGHMNFDIVVLPMSDYHACMSNFKFYVLIDGLLTNQIALLLLVRDRRTFGISD